MEKHSVIEEILRVSRLLDTKSLSQDEFKQHGSIGVTTVRNTFGTWNQAVEAAGLIPNPIGTTNRSRMKLDDDAYLKEIVRLANDHGKLPTVSLMNAQGKYSDKPYRDRWGSFAKACDVAMDKFGIPMDRRAEENTFQEVRKT